MKEAIVVLLLVVPLGILVVLGDTLTTVQPPRIQSKVVPLATIEAPAVPTVSASQDWLTEALSWMNVRYLWGGCDRRGVDCSCFVQNVLASVGIRAPRVTTQQVLWARPVPRDQMQPMDLVFFNNTCDDCGSNPTHVGLYLGNGQMIQAGGKAVSIQPVFSGFYGQRFASAGRVPQ